MVQKFLKHPLFRASFQKIINTNINNAIDKQAKGIKIRFI